MKPAAFIISCLALGACGARGGATGTPDAGAPVPRGFDVVATLTMKDVVAGMNTLPATNHFTLWLDPAAGRAVGGGGGEASRVELRTTDGSAFRITRPIGVGVSQSRCTGLLRLAYETIELTVTGDRLVGKATGRGFFASTVGAVLEVAFTATLEGAPDTTPPFLVVPDGATTDDPLSPFQVWTSEPLPATALARMVGGDGEVAGLVPEVIEGDVPVIASFAKASLTLPPGQAFQALYSDDVTDLAGNLAPMGVGLRLSNVGAAPLLGPDGFESAAGTFGGAAIVHTGERVAISGDASAYIGAADAPTPGDLVMSPKLVVRMAVPPGATKLSFAYRVLAPNKMIDLGTIQVGSVGRAPGEAVKLPEAKGYQLTHWGPQTFLESANAALTVPLPDAVGPEVVIVIRAAVSCMTGFGSPGLLLDDLRLE